MSNKQLFLVQDGLPVAVAHVIYDGDIWLNTARLTANNAKQLAAWLLLVADSYEAPPADPDLE